MRHYPPAILQLIQGLSKLPGIGPKTAERLSLHILQMPKAEAEHLSAAILAVSRDVGYCKQCFALSDQKKCVICDDPTRDHHVLCVVEKPADMVAIEKSAAYRGLYHVLHGVLSPMDGIGPNDIRIRELLSRVKTSGISEVILATGTNVEGESTADYIAERLSTLPIKTTRIASGVPMGGDLKFVDRVSLKRAIEKRRTIPND